MFQQKFQQLQFVLRPEPAKDRVRFTKPDEDEASFRDVNVRGLGGILSRREPSRDQNPGLLITLGRKMGDYATDVFTD